MDLEANRIKTRLTLPFIPVKNLNTLVVVLPETAEGDGRLVGSGTGWLLSELGVSNEILTTTSTAAEALRKHDADYNIPANMFAEAEELSKRQRLKAMFENMETVLEDSGLLTKIFGSASVARAKVLVEEVLDEYEAVDNPTPRRRAAARR